MASCANCGSENISFKRENAGEIRGKRAKQIVHRTVGYCKDCGYTWVVSNDPVSKKRKIWLWVLGWVFIFPLPLTILLLRKQNMRPAVKYAIIAVAWIVFFLIGFSGTSKDNAATSSAEQQISQGEESPVDMQAADDSQKALQDKFVESIGGSGLTFYDSVRNDVTGKWRCAVINTGENMVDHALDYYKAYFKSDDELHFICNLGLKTTTSISVVFGKIQVDVHEYVDKEEHDAKVLNSGSLLGSYMIDIETGEVEALPAVASAGGQLSFTIMDGEIGEYGVEVILNRGTDSEDREIAYYIPAGDYSVTNLNEKGGEQVSVYSGGPEKDGEWEYFVADENCARPIVVMAGKTVELEIKEGQFVVLSDGASNIQFTLK